MSMQRAETGDGVFLGVAALLCAISATVTVVWCTSMSGMWMPMRGRMAAQSALPFIAMWFVMTVAMMTPVLTPMLRRYRRAVADASPARLDRSTAIVGLGYFSVWAVLGVAVSALGASAVAAQSAIPALAGSTPVVSGIVTGIVIVAAGALQFTPWTRRHLMCCRNLPGAGLAVTADAGTAWRYGLRLGLHCSCASAGPMAVLLVVGIMNVPVMALVTAAIAVERLAPAGERVARLIGAVLIGAGLIVVVIALGAMAGPHTADL